MNTNHDRRSYSYICLCVAYPLVCLSGVLRNFFRGVFARNFFGGVFARNFFGGVFARNFFSGGSTNSVEDRGQRERGSGGGSPLVRGYTQFVNE
jgi:hypothetical protein